MSMPEPYDTSPINEWHRARLKSGQRRQALMNRILSAPPMLESDVDRLREALETIPVLDTEVTA